MSANLAHSLTSCQAGQPVPGPRPARLLFAALAFIALLSMACSDDPSIGNQELAYASEASGEVRDQLGPKSKVVARTSSGQRLLILERMNRWARVRVLTNEAADGQPALEGWMHQRQMVTEKVYEQFRELAEKSRSLPNQGSGLVRRLANMRLEPGRTTQVFYQLVPDERIDVLQHTIAAREATAEEVRRGITEPIPEDWLLVRASENRTGWVLESLAEQVPPMEVARFREGQRIRAWFEIYRERAADGEHAWYLWASVPKLEGARHEFEEIRLFVWNPAASRYETAYRERNLKGFLPISVSMMQSETGESPQFSFEHETGAGERMTRNYFMVGRQVRLKR